MARTSITKTNGTNSYPTAGVTVTFEAADTTDQNQFIMTGSELLIARNVGASPATVTINSVANALGRTKDITAQAIAAGAYAVFGPFKELSGWQQSGGALHFEGSATDIEFAVIKVPRP